MVRQTVQRKVLTISRVDNAIDYLSELQRALTRLPNDSMAWKWAIIGAHGAIYNFAVHATKHGNIRNVLATSERTDRQWLKSFDQILGMCQDQKWMGRFMSGRALVLTSRQERSMRILQRELRNEFEHFKSSFWIIGLEGLPALLIDCLDIIRYLVFETRTFPPLRYTQDKRVRSLLFQNMKLLKRLDSNYRLNCDH